MIFLKVQTEKSLIIFLKSLIFFWIILFEFWLILFVSAAFFLIHVDEKFPIFFFFYLFYSEWFCWSFWCGFFWKNDFLVQFCVCIFGEYFFSVGNFRQILILLWCQFFFVHLPFFFLSCWIFSKTLGGVFIRIFEDLMLLSQVPLSRLFLKSKASSIF